MRDFLEKYPLLKNRYFLVAVLFSIWMIVFDQNNLFHQYESQQELKRMKEKEAFLDSEIVKNQRMLDRLENDPDELERYAREEYWMKKDSEDLFIIIDSADSAFVQPEL